MLRDKYMSSITESSSGEEICYPTLMTDPYEGKYYEFYWSFNNTQFEKRKFSKKNNIIKFYKLHLNEIKFATNKVNFESEIYLSLEKETDTISKYKGIYTRTEKTRWNF